MLHYILLGTWPLTLLKVSLSHFSTIFYKFLFSHFIYFYQILHNTAAVLFESCFQPSALPAQPVEYWDSIGIWYIPAASILIVSASFLSLNLSSPYFFHLLFMFHPIIYFKLLQNYHFVWRLYDDCNAFSVDILQYQILYFPFTF